MPEPSATAEQKAVEVPLYTAFDVARYIRVPVWAGIVAASRGRIHPEDVLGFHPQRWPYLADWLDGITTRPSDDRALERVSFVTFAGLFTHSFFFHAPPLPGRYAQDWNARVVALSEALFRSGELGLSSPDASSVALHLERWLGRDAHQERSELKKQFALRLDRVDVKDGVAVRLYPFSRDPAPDTPRVVVIDPEVRFGRPTVKGVPTDVLAERWRAGDSVTYLAEDYDLTPDEVDEALRYESLPPAFPLLLPFIG